MCLFVQPVRRDALLSTDTSVAGARDARGREGSCVAGCLSDCCEPVEEEGF